MIGADAALLGLIGVIVGSLLSHRGARRVAGEDRLWQRKADVYLELLDWLDDDLAMHRVGQPPADDDRAHLENRLRAFGTQRVHTALAAYLEARRQAVAGRSDGEARLDIRTNFLRLAVSNDLAALPSRSDDLAVTLIGSRPFLGVMSRFAARVRNRRSA